MSKTLKQKVDTAIKLLKTAEQQAEKEEWRDVKGYEGRYQVSNQGRVNIFRSFFLRWRYRNHIEPVFNSTFITFMTYLYSFSSM